jgi:hypothetical protein
MYINLGDFIEDLKASPFSGCVNIEAFVGGDPWWVVTGGWAGPRMYVYDGAIYAPALTTMEGTHWSLHAYPPANARDEYTVREKLEGGREVLGLEASCFANAKNLKHIFLPNTV